MATQIEKYIRAANYLSAAQIYLQEIINSFQDELAHHRSYIIEHGDDLMEITNRVWEQR